MASVRNKTWYKAISIIIGALLLLFSIGPAYHYSFGGMGVSFTWLSVGFWGMPTETQQVPAEPASLLLILIAAALIIVMCACRTATARAQGGTGVSALYLVLLGYEIIHFSLLGPEFVPAPAAYLMLLLIVVQLALSVAVLIQQKTATTSGVRS